MAFSQKISHMSPRNMSAGFTIIEMLISIFVFGIAVTFLVATYLNAQETEQAILSYVSTVENLRATLENMARDIRTGCFMLSCIPPQEDTRNENPLILNSLAFTDRLGRQVGFCLGQCQFSNKQCIKKSIAGACTPASTDYITASDINITMMKFYVYSTDCISNPADQPKIVPVIEATAPFKNQDISFKVQTTITPRLLKTCR